MTPKSPNSYEILYNSNALVWAVINIYNKKFYSVSNNRDSFVVGFSLISDCISFIEEIEAENYSKPYLMRLNDFKEPQFFYLDYSYCVSVF